ncbi:hypothetical protein PFICI_00259 [Pestalotiopsis fici W106-1]|uniref:Uncharacterized protein n=1 Tax=Pestalotiopsis fici (strain W106-1 / CGMCC3.15140) TaxID=1229662 RepID=W3XMD2_PESFW|nr:uncharacterized protein PFICI_00259 [Pestalotiopsis fici W106-1]ETS86431.1 hypothetical protein PFICI_00259 [Pestalotiopsis fici W106-1]
MDDNQNTRGQRHPKQPWGELKPQLSPRTRAVTCTDPVVIGESIINRSRPDGSSRIAPLFEQDGRISSHYHGLAAKKEDLQIGNDDDDEDDDPFVETNENMIMNKNEGSITAPANRNLVSAVAAPFVAIHSDDEDKKNDTLSFAGHQTHLLDNNHHHHKGANSNAIMSSMARDLPTQSKQQEQQQQQQHKQRTTTTTTANTTVVSSTGSPQPKIPGRRRNQTMPTAATSPYRHHRRTNAISVARRFSLQQHLREHGQPQQIGEAQDDEDETKTDDDKDGENKTSSSHGSSSPPPASPSTSPMPAPAPAPRRHPSLPRSAPIDIASPKSPASKRANAEAMELKEAARRRDGGGHNSTFSSSQSSPGGGGDGEPMVVGDMSPWDTAARSPARK